MTPLAYTNENGKEVSLRSLDTACGEIGEHISALQDITRARLQNTSDTEEAGVLMVLAASLKAIGDRVFDLRVQSGGRSA